MDTTETNRKNKLAVLSVEDWRKAQSRARREGVVKGWHDTQKEPPPHNQWVLVCSDPKWGPYNPPVSLMYFVVISRSEFVRKQFAKECEPVYLAENCMGFDGAFLTSDLQACIVCDGPWFPDYWKPLPSTPFD